MKKLSYLVNDIILILFIVIGFAKLLVLNLSLFNIISCFIFLNLSIIVSLLLPRKINRYAGLVFVLIFDIYFISQHIYHRAFSQYFRLATALGLSKEASGVTNAIKELLRVQDFWSILITFITFSLVIIADKLQVKKNLANLRKFILFPLSLVIVLVSLQVYLLNYSRKYANNFMAYHSNYYIYHNVPNTNEFVKYMGLYTLLQKDIVSNFERKKSLSKEDGERIKTYLASNKEDKTNEFTSLFKGKNLFIVQAESLNNIGIDKDLTPNIYYYQNSGITVSDFCTPLLVGSTSDTEFMANTSLLPVTSHFPVCYEYGSNTFKNTLAQIFKKEGYATLAFHNNYGEYYNRFKLFKSFGYDFFDSTKLAVDNLCPDSLLGEKIAYILAEKEHFLGYWITYSGHQAYNLQETGVKEEDVKKIKAKYPQLSDEYVAYFAKAMDLDKALGDFVNVMDWQGRLKDLVIILIGDHHAKAIDFKKGSNIDKVLNLNETDNPYLGYTSFFIWSPACSGKKISGVGTAKDILPTVTNLWGISKPNTSMGNDLLNGNAYGFNADDDVWDRDNKYNALINKYEGNESEALSLLKRYQNEKDIASLILNNDYFALEK